MVGSDKFSIYPLFAEATTLTGIGPRFGKLLAKLTEHNGTGGRLVDLLWHLPFAVIDRRNAPEVAGAKPGEVATLTVVAALLPMLFVSGLMGPYMAPIPVNASAAMIFSFFVAVIIAPWLMVRFARMAIFGQGHHADDAHGGRLGRAYEAVAAQLGEKRRPRTGAGSPRG